jgi:hypothetical protein
LRFAYQLRVLRDAIFKLNGLRLGSYEARLWKNPAVSNGPC